MSSVSELEDPALLHLSDHLAAERSACDQFLYSIGHIIGMLNVKITQRHVHTLCNLGARELSDLNMILFERDGEKALRFLECPRETAPRG